MFTGWSSQTGLFEQFAGFFGLEEIDLAGYAGRSVPMDVVLGRERTQRSKVIKQADVVALLGLLPEEFPGDSGRTNFRYYEPRCGHGSSLSGAMHGLVAARLGTRTSPCGISSMRWRSIWQITAQRSLRGCTSRLSAARGLQRSLALQGCHCRATELPSIQNCPQVGEP